METIGQITQLPSSTSTSVSVSKSTSTINTNTRMTFKQVQSIAQRIEDKLGAQIPSRFPLYCKVARTLPEHVIWQHVEAALSKPYRHQLFTALCKESMADLGVTMGK